MLDVLWNNARLYLKVTATQRRQRWGQRDGRVSSWYRKKKEGQRRAVYPEYLWRRNERWKKAHGGQGKKGSIKNEANAHISPLRLCPLVSSAWWNPIYKAIILSWWCFFSALAGKIPAAVTYTFPLWFWVDKVGWEKRGLVVSARIRIAKVKAMGVYIRQYHQIVQDGENCKNCSEGCVSYKYITALQLTMNEGLRGPEAWH